MSKYKRLNEKDSRKLENYKKVRKTTSKAIKWISFASFVVVCLLVGVVSLYYLVDSRFKGDEGGSEVQTGDDLAVEDFLDDSSQKEAEESLKDEEAHPVQVQEESPEQKDTLQKEEPLDKGKDQRKDQEKDQEKEQGKKVSDKEKLYDFSEWNAKCDKTLMVINRDNPIKGSVPVKTKICRGKEIALEAFDALQTMIEDAKKEGIVLWISSGYRSVQLQTKLFNNQTSREMQKGAGSVEQAQARAQTVVARPGCSEHNTGLAVDFNGVKDDFYTTKEYKWLMDNAARYGFIERYRKKWQDSTGVIYEPWHFRYVGPKEAPLIKESNMCLEQYILANKICK